MHGNLALKWWKDSNVNLSGAEINARLRITQTITEPRLKWQGMELISVLPSNTNALPLQLPTELCHAHPPPALSAGTRTSQLQSGALGVSGSALSNGNGLDFFFGDLHGPKTPCEILTCRALPVWCMHNTRWGEAAGSSWNPQPSPIQAVWGSFCTTDTNSHSSFYSPHLLKEIRLPIT